MRFDIREDISELKLSLFKRIDQETGAIRGLFITTAPGQELVYAEKRREAEAIMADLATPDGETPHITAEAALSGMTRYAKAMEVLTMSYQWAQVSTLIESRRLAFKEAVRSATTATEARAAIAGLNWDDIRPLAPSP